MEITRPDLSRIWASGAPAANVEDPDVTTPGKFNFGWVAEVPTYQNFNFLQRYFTTRLAYIGQKGIPEWDDEQEYHVGSIAQSAGFLFKSKQNDNTGNNVDDTNWWDPVISDIQPEYFGAKGDGSTPDLEALSAAFSYAANVNGTVKSGRRGASYRVDGTLNLPSGRYNVDFQGAEILVSTGVLTGVTVGTAGPNPFRGRVDGLRVVAETYNVNAAGIDFINVVESNIKDPQVIDFGVSYAARVPPSSRVAYNHIDNPLGQNHAIGILFLADGGYVNENTVSAGRLSCFIAGRLVDQIRLDNAGGAGAGHNRFIGVSIEGFSGGGSTGRSAVRCLNAANDNVFLFCRGERYGSGWDDGTVYFGANTARNYFEDTRLDTTVEDVSGSNQYITPTLGDVSSDATGGNPHNVIKRTRNVVNDDEALKFALDFEDTSASIDSAVGFAKYKTPASENRAGSIVSYETGYGEVHRIDDAGTIYPRDNFADLGADSQRFRRVYTLGVRFSPISAASAENLTTFVDQADGVLKFKDGAGVIRALY